MAVPQEPHGANSEHGPGLVPAGRTDPVPPAPADRAARNTPGNDEAGAALEYAETLLAETREELGRADSKASILFAAVGVVAGVAGGAVVAGDWSPSELGNRWEGLWWLGAALVGAAAVELVLAVVPRVRHRGDRDKVAYFGHVVQFDDQAELEASLRRAARDPLARVLDQLRVVSGIVQRKYRCTRWALVALMVAAAVISVSVLGNAIFHP